MVYLPLFGCALFIYQEEEEEEVEEVEEAEEVEEVEEVEEEQLLDEKVEVDPNAPRGGRPR